MLSDSIKKQIYQLSKSTYLEKLGKRGEREKENCPLTDSK
jgi:hypothetical protein